MFLHVHDITFHRAKNSYFYKNEINIKVGTDTIYSPTRAEYKDFRFYYEVILKNLLN